MIDVCPSCNSPKQPNQAYCSMCAENEYEVYKTVKDYLRQKPNSNAMQIANATGLPVSKIISYIRDGSLTVVDSEGRKPR